MLEFIKEYYRHTYWQCKQNCFNDNSNDILFRSDVLLLDNKLTSCELR